MNQRSGRESAASSARKITAAAFVEDSCFLNAELERKLSES